MTPHIAVVNGDRVIPVPLFSLSLLLRDSHRARLRSRIAILRAPRRFLLISLFEDAVDQQRAAVPAPEDLSRFAIQRRDQLPTHS